MGAKRSKTSVSLACLGVCLFASIKRQNGRTNRPNFVWDLTSPQEGLWKFEFLKLCLHQNSFFFNLKNPRNFSIKSAKCLLVFVLQCTP